MKRSTDSVQYKAKGDNQATRKKSRIKYTREQISQLERVFEGDRYPDSDTQERLALHLGVTMENVAIWFQNRRSKFRRQCHAEHVSWMRGQIFQNTGYHGNKSMFGTPVLPALISACHVLSPLEAQIARGDSAVERPSLRRGCPYHLLNEVQEELNTTPKTARHPSSTASVLHTPSRRCPSQQSASPTISPCEPATATNSDLNMRHPLYHMQPKTFPSDDQMTSPLTSLCHMLPTFPSVHSTPLTSDVPEDRIPFTVLDGSNIDIDAPHLLDFSPSYSPYLVTSHSQQKYTTSHTPLPLTRPIGLDHLSPSTNPGLQQRHVHQTIPLHTQSVMDLEDIGASDDILPHYLTTWNRKDLFK